MWVLDISRERLTSAADLRTLVCRDVKEEAMTDTKTVGQELQGEILKTVRKSQDAVVDTIQMWADAVQSIKPQLPEVGIPFADKLPKPSELVSGAYDFASNCLPCSASSPRTCCTRPRRCSTATPRPPPRRRAPRPSKARSR